MSESVSIPGWTRRYSAVTTTPQQLFPNGIHDIANDSIVIYADSGNSARIFVGFTSGITTDSADSTDGFPLPANGNISIPFRHASNVWLKAAVGTQKAWAMGV